MASLAPPVDFVLLNLDGFLGQRVLYLWGKWVNRREAIKYVAIVAHGAHSNAPETEAEKILATISYGVKIKPTSETTYGVEFLGKFGLDQTIHPFRYMPDALDPVLVELLAAAAFTARSEDTKRLESIILAELR